MGKFGNTIFSEIDSNGNKIIYPSNIKKREKPLLIAATAVLTMIFSSVLFKINIYYLAVLVLPFSIYMFCYIIPKTFFEESEIVLRFDEEYSKQVPEQHKLGIYNEKQEVKKEKRQDIVVNLQSKQEMQMKTIETIGVFDGYGSIDSSGECFDRK